MFGDSFGKFRNSTTNTANTSFGSTQTTFGFGSTQTPFGFGSTSTTFGGSTSTPLGFGSTSTPVGFGSTPTPVGFGFTQTPSGFGSTSATSGTSSGCFCTSATNKPTDNQGTAPSSSMFGVSDATATTTTTANTPGFAFAPSTSSFAFSGTGTSPFGSSATNKPTDNQGQSSIFKNDENKKCCGICLAAYKSPRILPCNHIFCRLCLIKLADKKQDGALTDVNAEELVPLTCPLCRKEINLPINGVDKLPMYFEDDNDNEESNDVKDKDIVADDNDAEDVDEDHRDLCVVCENSVPAEYECFQCQKVLCDSCKKIHDNLLKHDVQDLKLDLTQAQDKCVKHLEVKVGYFCLDCGSTVCKECVKSEHSLHQTQTLKSYLMEIDGELREYSSTIKKKLENVEMSKVMFSSNTESKVLENIENVKTLGENFKIELEKACRLENKNQHEDKTLLNRIISMERKIKESKKQRKLNQNLIPEIKELQARITTHGQFYLPNNVDDIINNQIGTMDIQMGRLFAFQLNQNRNGEFDFFFGNLNWTLSISQQSYDLSISLTAFRKPEDTLLIESITTTVTISVAGGADDATALRVFSKTFNSKKDQLKYNFKNYGNIASRVKVLFKNTNIKRRTQVE